MHPFILYLLRSAIVSGIFYGYYYLSLRNRRMHTFNRIYLLSAVAFSLVLPVLHFDWYTAEVIHNSGVIRLLQTVDASDQSVEYSVAGAQAFNWYGLLWIVYLSVTAFLLASATRKIYQLLRLKKTSAVTRLAQVIIVSTTLPQAPFSFLNCLFWNEGIDRSSEEGKQMMEHELTHIRQRHTIDKLLFEAVIAFFWVNPFFRLMRKELSMVHEFQADEAALDGRDTGNFAAMLLSAHLAGKYPGFIQPFFCSPIKRRLLMLHNKKTTKVSLRMLTVLPLVAATTFLFSFSAKEKHEAKIHGKFTIVIDAGHGGTDAGGINKDGFKEKDLNLAISTEIIKLAPEYHINAIPTRKDDDYPSLQGRAKMAAGVRADAFISVHLNANEPNAPEHKKYELYISEKNPHYKESQLLASAILQQLVSDNPVIMQKGLIVLKENTVPGVLIECGNIDNAVDVAAVTNPVKLENMCRKILEGIVMYQSQQRK